MRIIIMMIMLNIKEIRNIYYHINLTTITTIKIVTVTVILLIILNIKYYQQLHYKIKYYIQIIHLKNQTQLIIII